MESPTGSGEAPEAWRWSAVAVGVSRAPVLLALLACTETKADLDAAPQEVNPIPVGMDSVPCIADEFPIVFTSTRGDSRNGLELYVMSLDGSVQQIGYGPRFIAPSWSPDGRTVAFRHASEDVPELTIASEVQLIAPDGNERVALTPREILPFDQSSILPVNAPSWSPDGQSLAYASLDGANGYRVWLVAREGGEPRRLRPELVDSHHSPSWAPDQSKIAFVDERFGQEDIWLVDVDQPQRPVVDLTRGRVQMPRSLRWAPDGKHLAFSAIDALASSGTSSDFEIYLLDIDTLTVTTLTDNAVLDLHPAWSPDGTELLLARGLSAADSGEEPLDTQTLELWRVPLQNPAQAERISSAGWMNCAADWFWRRCSPQ